MIAMLDTKITETACRVDKILVEDIVNKNAQTTLILESPHTDEMRAGFPLAGPSGHCSGQVQPDTFLKEFSYSMGD
jgi:hypothetical protein